MNRLALEEKAETSSEAGDLCSDETSRLAWIWHEAHPSETAAEVLAVAGGFGRAAALSFFSAVPTFKVIASCVDFLLPSPVMLH
jgi:hypothetical protein